MLWVGAIGLASLRTVQSMNDAPEKICVTQNALSWHDYHAYMLFLVEQEHCNTCWGVHHNKEQSALQVKDTMSQRTQHEYRCLVGAKETRCYCTIHV
jgi:hypothetical protein